MLVRIIRFAYSALLSATYNIFLQFQAKTEKSVIGLAGYRDERPWRVTLRLAFRRAKPAGRDSPPTGFAFVRSH